MFSHCSHIHLTLADIFSLAEFLLFNAKGFSVGEFCLRASLRPTVGARLVSQYCYHINLFIKGRLVSAMNRIKYNQGKVGV